MLAAPEDLICTVTVFMLVVRSGAQDKIRKREGVLIYQVIFVHRRNTRRKGDPSGLAPRFFALMTPLPTAISYFSTYRSHPEMQGGSQHSPALAPASASISAPPPSPQPLATRARQGTGTNKWHYSRRHGTTPVGDENAEPTIQRDHQPLQAPAPMTPPTKVLFAECYSLFSGS